MSPRIGPTTSGLDRAMQAAGERGDLRGDCRPMVGITYQKELHEFIERHDQAIDYLEIVPDTAWTDHGASHHTRYVDDLVALKFFQSYRRRKPIVAHSIGLSIGSAHRFRTEHVEQIARWDQQLDFAWHSDHLAYNVVLDRMQREILLGVPFPVPTDQQVMDMLLPRIAHVQASVGKRFLLENNVHYIQYRGQETDSAEFLNRLCKQSGCGLLLDLHNLYVDGRNGNIDVEDFLGRLDLRNVQEIHMAGGLTHDGVYLDSHSGAAPESLWIIAGQVLRSCDNLRGITFELLGSWYERMGELELLETMHRMRSLVKPRLREQVTGS